MNKLKQPFWRLLACAACLLSGAAPCAAASMVVVDNSPPDHLAGNNLGFAFQAEDFKLSAGTTLTGIRFWSLEGDGAYRGRISWSIRENSRRDAPGALLARGTQADVARTALGAYDGLQEFRNDFALNAPLTLGPGTYWLVLHNGAPRNLGDPNEFLWESAAGNGTLRGVERFARSGPWSTTGAEHAFQVSAVAEPTEVLMLLIGMTLLVCLKRRDPRSDNFA
jgi:hypothetical protein